MPAAATARSSAMDALVALEEALVLKAKEHGVNDEMERRFDRYQKVKALAIGGTSGEAAAALRRALIEAIQLVF